MRVATLQFNPRLGHVGANIQRADELLAAAAAAGQLRDVQVLVAPEMALTGYNFPSLAAITPYLEPTAAGPSSIWARETALRLNCIVSVGYPETTVPSTQSNPTKHQNYNSTITVGPDGRVLAHYRKTHLYYTDERWASPSPTGWLTVDLPLPPPTSLSTPSRPSPDRPPFLHPHDVPKSPLSSPPSSLPQPTTSQPITQQTVPTAFAICMDLNPYHFLPPLASAQPPLVQSVLATGATLLLCSTAWSTHQLREDFDATGRTDEPDWDSVGWWAMRLAGLADGGRDVLDGDGIEENDDDDDGDDGAQDDDEEEEADDDEDGATKQDQAHKQDIIIVIANRSGWEPGASDGSDRHGDRRSADDVVRTPEVRGREDDDRERDATMAVGVNRTDALGGDQRPDTPTTAAETEIQRRGDTGNLNAAAATATATATTSSTSTRTNDHDPRAAEPIHPHIRTGEEEDEEEEEEEREEEREEDVKPANDEDADPWHAIVRAPAPPALYVGSSTVMSLRRRKRRSIGVDGRGSETVRVTVWSVMGRGEEGVQRVDTDDGRLGVKGRWVLDLRV